MARNSRDASLAKAVSVSERLSSYAKEKGVEDVDTTSIIRKWRRG